MIHTQKEAIERLREWIKPGDTLYTILRHVSRSGMFRVIDVVKINGPEETLTLGWNVAAALGMGYDHEREGVRISGCGMDMGFEIVYNLGRVLFEDFRCTGKGCQSNDHSNERTRNYRKGRKHSDGGYALRQRWL